MKVRLQMEGIGFNYTRELCALFGERDPMPVCFLQLVGKRYPLKVPVESLSQLSQLNMRENEKKTKQNKTKQKQKKKWYCVKFQLNQIRT